MRYCFTSPPMGMTWATPGMVSRRGRSTQSAYSRTCIGLTLSGSAGRAMRRISPMIEEIGPICGMMPAGSCSRTRFRRHAPGLGHQRDHGLVEVREDIHRHLACGQGAIDDQQEAHAEDDEALLEARVDDEIEHGIRPPAGPPQGA